ncbi:beta-glucan synthesis-associated protein [Mycena floridula]|nr:beta-glucan synthesis-associated protein [Mycena floridula]
MYPRDITNSPSTANLLPPSQRSSASSASSHRFPSHSNSMAGSPYNTGYGRSSAASSLTNKFSLSADPEAWGSDLSTPEPDDFLHNADPRKDRQADNFGAGNVFTYRGLTNLGCLIILGIGLVSLFAGYPLVSYFSHHPLSTLGGFNLGGINASGQVPSMSGNWGLIDVDTPQSAYTIQSYNSPKSQLQLVFSDEFNTEGRSFYPGDDPYWEAVDLHYWGTNNLEWYDPAAVTTKGGALQITLSAKQTHDLNYQGGMVTSWNKFCFTGGLIQTSVTLPGVNNIVGLWPAVWTMGNLGRAGYGASLDGMWPYTYDSCDVGTAPNQTFNGLPLAATVNGDPSNGDALSYLPGQRLSRCTCPGESHPGPMHSDKTYVGRAAPEIDIFEAQIDLKVGGTVSQSGQWAPFNDQYQWFNTTDNLIIPDASVSTLNTYMGGAFQQATSVVSLTDQNCYQLDTGCFSTYGFEYKPGYDEGYITWINNGKVAWTLNGAGMAADSRVEISARPVPLEPMYILMNLGMSRNFGDVDLDHLTFPAIMSVDWIRVYQPKNAINIGCDPPDFPTAAYIEQYIEAYTNPNLTTWVDDYKQPIPKNSFLGQC